VSRSHLTSCDVVLFWGQSSFCRGTCPCRYLLSASPSAAFTTWIFSASAFSTAATLQQSNTYQQQSCNIQNPTSSNPATTRHISAAVLQHTKANWQQSCSMQTCINSCRLDGRIASAAVQCCRVSGCISSLDFHELPNAQNSI